MKKTLIYISLINALFLITKSAAREELYLDLTQKIIRPISRRPLPPRPAEETEFPELLTTLTSNDDWDTFSDPNIPERPSTPTPFTNLLSIAEEDDDETNETFIVSTFHANFNPINLSTPQPYNDPNTRERIMVKNTGILSQKEPIPLRILMILRTSLNRHISQENRVKYKSLINEKVQEYEP